MNTFCPFLRETCRGNECMMFRNENCLVVSFLQGIFEDTTSSEETVVISRNGFMRDEAQVPDWIKNRTPEEIAVEILAFKEKEFSEGDSFSFYSLSNLFWMSKGVEQYRLPPVIRLKIQRANILARTQINRDAQSQRNEQIEREKEELPSLVSHCIDWARSHGLKRVTLADVDAYIIERNLDILKETRRALYSFVNVKLKSKF